jgi:two-component system sensor histidine kinase HydH
MRLHVSRLLHSLLPRALSIALLLVVVVGLHGWLRGLALGLTGALVVLVERSARAARRSSLAAHEAVGTHVQWMRELSSLQDTLAHELNTPLATIKGVAGLMALDPAPVPDRLRVLQAEVKRMQQTLEELLTFTRPLTPLAVETVDLREVVKQVVEQHEDFAAQRDVALIVEPTHPMMARCDPRKVKQIVMNLLHNAIEASPAGDSIALTLAADGERVQFGVLDRGPGVPPDQIARIVEAGVTSKPGGAGLGLTIARALARQHGGSLELENRAGGGLAARVDLPLK